MNETRRVDDARGDERTTLRIDELVIDDRYRLRGVLGQGAMGVVYEAEHLRVGLRVAVKFLLGDPAADPITGERFRREARAASAAGHPNIVVVYDAGELPDGRPFIVMELLRGRALGRVLAEDGPFSAARACRIVRDIARGIEAAHRVGVIHRDLKPNNVFVLPASETTAERVKIVDFGIAIGSDTDVRMTQPGMIIGTPMYMAPEQCTADQPRPQSDLYALGVVLFELLAGHPPFQAEQVVHLLTMKTSRAAPRLGIFRPDVPDELDELVGDCLEIDPARRPASATVVVERLEAILAELDPSAIELRPAVTSALRSQRPQPRAFALLFGVVALSVLAGVLVWLEPPPDVVRDPASEWATRTATAVPREPAPKRDAAVGTSAPLADAEVTPPPVVEPVVVSEPKPSVDPAPRPTVPRPHAEPPAPVVTAAAPARERPREEDDSSSAACQHSRRSAQDCRESHDWQGVLRHTDDAQCWSSKRERTRLRVLALMELGRFDACLREADGSTDPPLQRSLTICRLRAQER